MSSHAHLIMMSCIFKFPACHIRYPCLLSSPRVLIQSNVITFALLSFRPNILDSSKSLSICILPLHEMPITPINPFNLSNSIHPFQTHCPIPLHPSLKYLSSTHVCGQSKTAPIKQKNEAKTCQIPTNNHPPNQKNLTNSLT